jgi:hypothetical protein
MQNCTKTPVCKASILFKMHKDACQAHPKCLLFRSTQNACFAGPPKMPAFQGHPKCLLSGPTQNAGFPGQPKMLAFQANPKFLLCRSTITQVVASV